MTRSVGLASPNPYNISYFVGGVLSLIAKGRLSDSPYIDSVWRGHAEADQTLMCPADGRWNIRITRLNSKVSVCVEGPITQAIPKTHPEGVDWTVIKLSLGTYLPTFAARGVLNGEVRLPSGAGRSFWLTSAVWPHFDDNNAEEFVAALVRQGVLATDSIITATLNDQPVDLAPRSVRHRFAQIIGISPTRVLGIEQARKAMMLLQGSVAILDVVHQLGYADQSHLTRSLKQYMGHTPAKVTPYNYER